MRSLRIASVMSLAAQGLRAQSNLGTITGAAFDSTGAAVPNVSTGVASRATSTSTGNYTTPKGRS